MRSDFVETVSRTLQRDDRVVLLLGDISVYAFRQLAGLIPSRVVNTGVTEQASIGMAAGLARMGKVPVFHTIAPFATTRALEQIKIDFGYQKLGGNIVTVGNSFDYSYLGATHHCPEDVAILTAIPRVNVVCPGTGQEFRQIFERVYNNYELNYFRLSESSNQQSEDVGLGGVKVLRTSRKGPTLLAFGNAKDVALRASEGMDVTFLYANSVTAEVMTNALSRRTSNAILLVEPFYEYSAVPLLLSQSGAHQVRVVSVGIKREFLHSYHSPSETMRLAGLSEAKISAAINLVSGHTERAFWKFPK